jgi:hypothetical protein
MASSYTEREVPSASWSDSTVPKRLTEDFVYNRALMHLPAWIQHRGPAGGVLKQLGLALLALMTGGLVLPVLIYFCGIALLGRYEGASLERTYRVVLGGLSAGSVASWVVVLGPYLLLQLAGLLRAWWHAGAKNG